MHLLSYFVVKGTVELSQRQKVQWGSILVWRIKAWTKCPIFCRRNFQMRFLEWKFLYFDSYFVPMGPMNNRSSMVHVIACRQRDHITMSFFKHSKMFPPTLSISWSITYVSQCIFTTRGSIIYIWKTRLCGSSQWTTPNWCYSFVRQEQHRMQLSNTIRDWFIVK